MNILKLFKRIFALTLVLTLLTGSYFSVSYAASFEAKVTATKMAVREGRTADTTLIGYLEKGTVVTVIDYADGIALIEYKGKQGYARVSDMTRVSSASPTATPKPTQEPDHGLATVIEKEIAYYEKATSASKELGQLKKNDTVLVLEVDKNDWAKLEIGDETVYTRAKWLEIDDKAKATPSPVKNSASGKATVKVSSIPIYASASTDSKVLMTLKKGQSFTLLATGNGWAKLQNGKNIGYVRLIGLSIGENAAPTAEPTAKPTEEVSKSGMATVTASSAYVYASPSESSKRLMKVTKGDTYTLLATSNGWAKLQNGKHIGYIKLSAISISSGATATPAATSTPKPTNTPEPEKSKSGLGTVSVHSLYIYEKASTGSTKKGLIYKGETYTVLATSGEWARIEKGSVVGYVKLSGLTIDEGATATPAPTPTPEPEPDPIGSVKVNVHSMNFYEQPSSGSKKLGYVYRDNTYTLYAVSGEWAKIKSGSKIGYVKLDGLTVYKDNEPAPTAKPTQEPSLTGIATITASSIYVYASPSESAKKMCLVYKGDTFIVLGTSNGWAKLQNGKHIGYARTAHLSINEGAQATPVPTATPLATATPIPVPDKIEGPEAEVSVNTMYVYNERSVSSDPIGSLKKSAVVTILDYNETWAKIYHGGKVGYCKTSSLKLTGNYTGATPKPTATLAPSASPKPTAPIQAIMEVDAFVNTSSAKIYSNVSTSSAVQKTVSAGFELTVLGTSGEWALVEYGSSRGYMLKNTLIAKSDATLTATMNSPAVISAQSIIVYKFASKYAPSYGTFKKGTEVTVLAYKDGWAMLKRGESIGYADADSISIVSEEKKPTLNSTCSLPALIQKGSTKAYTYATETSKVLGTYALGAEVTVLGYDDTWCLIQKTSTTKNTVSYVLKSNVLLASEVEIAQKGNYPGVVTSSSGAPVYKYATEVSKKLATLKKGATFNVIGQANGWGYIELNGNKGYMKLSNMYVQIDEFVSPTVKTLSATVVKSSLPVYSCALEESQYKSGTLSIGENVTVTAFTDKWARISINGGEVYALKAYLSNETYTPLNANSGSKTEINKLQKTLEDLGYFDGNPAGNYGSLTNAAVQRFQKQLGLDVTGNADLATLRILYSASAPESSIRTKTLSKNATGSDVTRLQNRLTYKGYMKSTIDGDYGSITESAVKIYQKEAGLTETGTADPATLRSLFSSSAPTNTSGNVAGSGTSSSGNGNYSTDPDDDLGSGTASAKAETVIEWGLKQLGKKYVYGDEGPNTFDCSGFTQFCYAKVGVKLRRSAQAQGYNDGTKITNISDLRRGDIVCFNTIDDSDLSDHVGIYLGNNQFVHASSGAGKIVISSLTNGYYKRVFSWGRRVL